MQTHICTEIPQISNSFWEVNVKIKGSTLFWTLDSSGFDKNLVNKQLRQIANNIVSPEYILQSKTDVQPKLI